MNARPGQRLSALIVVASVFALVVTAGAQASGAGAATKSGAASAKTKRHRVPDTWGGTYGGWPGVRTVALETTDGKSGLRQKGKAGYPVFIDQWGIDLEAFVWGADGVPQAVPAFSCAEGGGSDEHIPQGSFVSIATFPTSGPTIKVRKRRFSKHGGPYPTKGLTGIINTEYWVSGRFLSRNRVTGTARVSQVVTSYEDGSVLSTCHGSTIAWSACRGDLDPDAHPKPCLGVDQDDWLSPTGQAEPL